jgi:WD40 repeat protein/serine/threonine protein kinase
MSLSGQFLKGYAIGNQIGAGSFGAVYRATQASVGREVAIKIILPNFANQPEFIRRFETEAQIVARLEHPHIVPLFDYWREPDRAYLVMRLLPSNLRYQLEETGPLALPDAAQLADQMASALAMSHRQEVVHRDIKPDNILLDNEGNAYLTDFGLAEVIKSSLESSSDTVTGSPAYMSPEQLKGELLTSQSDIYAFGIVLYEMLVGQHPYEKLSISDLIRKHLLEPLPLIHSQRADVPEAVDRVLQRATAKDLAERYPDAQALAADFRNALLGHPTMTLTPVEENQPIANPYKGLRAFEEADAGDFFGREALVERLIRTLADDHPLARFLAVVGPSGSGKSSLVQAGLIPALRRGALRGSNRWFYLSMVPSTQPLRHLETALLSIAVRPVARLSERLRTDPRALVTVTDEILAGDDSELVLVVDQFEEVFTQVSDESERAQFLALLQTAVADPNSRVRVLALLRADYYDRPLIYEHFGALMQARTHIVLPLSEGELEDAIMLPAQRVGVQMEPNLIAGILADVRAEPGALPLLQYALTEVFERRQGRLMTLEGYEDIGRAAGALARRADRVYERMTPALQGTARQVFLRLVTLGEGTTDLRRRARRSELLSAVQNPDQLEQILTIFGRHRLLSFDHDPTTREPTIEVAHEALLREWRALRRWLDESREDVIQQRRLAGLAAEWLNGGKDPSFLLRGAQLEQFETWSGRTIMALADIERDFIAASIMARERQFVEERARREREAALEARARRFQRRLIAVMFAATVIALFLSFFAFGERQDAQDARDDAQHNAFFAQTQAASAATAAAIASHRADELQSLALVGDAQRALESRSFDLALALVVAANHIPNTTIEAENLLGEMAPVAPLLVFAGHSQTVNTVAASPDGQYALSGSDDNTLMLWNIATGQPIRTLVGHTERVRSVAFLPDGTRAISASDDETLIVWNVQTGEIIHTLVGHEDDVFAVAVNAEGQWAVSGGRDRVLIVWDLATGQLVRRLGKNEGHAERITCVAISPNGNLILSGSGDNTLMLWDAETGDILAQLEAHRDAVTDVAFSPDGARFLSASADGTLILWSTASRTEINRLIEHTERVSSVAFSPDGRWAVSGAGNQFAGASTDNSVILWDLLLAQPISRYVGHQFYVSDVAFGPNGRTILSASADKTLHLWASDYNVEQMRRAAVPNDTPYQAVGFSPDQTKALIAMPGNILALQTAEPDSPAPATRFFGEHAGAITAVTISPDGTRALTTSSDRMVRLWDLKTGKLVYTLAGHTNEVNSVVFSPDGTQALSASRDRSLILWDLSTGEAIRTFGMRHTNSINAVAFSPDGTQALSASADQSVILWDVATGDTLQVLRGHRGPVNCVAFSPDGRWAVSGSADKTLIIWDLQTGKFAHQLGATGDGHTDWVTAVAFSPDGMRILSGSRDRSVILWDAETGQVVRRDLGHNDTVFTVQFSQDSQFAVSASREGVIRRWPASQHAFVDWVAAHRYVRELTCEERDQYRLAPCE